MCSAPIEGCARSHRRNAAARPTALLGVARVLLVDDDPGLRDVLSLALSEAGHDVQVACDGVEGTAALSDLRHAVAIVDVNMPRMDGFTLVRTTRARGDSVPILLLTSRDSEIDEALGLDLGADDYVPKPFSTRVLLARVAALLRREASRAAGPSPARDVIEDGELTLDLARMEARLAGVPFPTTVTELRLLEALVRNAGVVMRRDRLLDLARGDDSVVGDRLVDTYVRRLRRKLEAIDPAFDRIETIIGAGYRLRGR